MEGFFSTLPFDPNLVYLALLLGLWVGVTAAYVPGTGVAELFSALILGGTVLWLTTLPANWYAVVIMVLGVTTFLVAPFIAPKYGAFAEIGLVFQAAGGLLLFDGVTVSPLIIGVTVILGLAYNRLLLLPMLKAQRNQTESDYASQVLGVVGRVVKPLDPVGTVNVNSELWTARAAEGESLDVGTPVIVRSQVGLELVVEKAKRDDGLRIMNGHSDS